MTKELRERLVKVAKAAAEKSKVGVRKARQKAVGDLKKKTEVSKDSVRRLEKHVSRPASCDQSMCHGLYTYYTTHAA